MNIKIFEFNKSGKVEFTRCELEKLLNDTYQEGYKDGEEKSQKEHWTWTTPSIPYLDFKKDIKINAIDDLKAEVDTHIKKTDKTDKTNKSAIAPKNQEFSIDLQLPESFNPESLVKTLEDITSSNAFSELTKELFSL